MLQPAASKINPHIWCVRKCTINAGRECDSRVVVEGSTLDTAARRTYPAAIIRKLGMVKEDVETLRECMRVFEVGAFDVSALQVGVIVMLEGNVLSEGKKKALVNFRNKDARRRPKTSKPQPPIIHT